MNAEISPEVLLALKKQVERAVRPVRAGKKRKLLMREELLAHLMTLFVEERLRLGRDLEAVVAANNRFGEPHALTAELNRSVGWEERANYVLDSAGRRVDAWLGFRHDIPLWRAALRIGLAMSGFSLLAAASTFILIWFLDPGRFDSSTNDPVLWQAIPFLGLGVWAYILAILAIGRAGDPTDKRFRWLSAIAQAVFWSFVFAILAGAFWWSITFSMDSVVERLPTIVLSAGGILPPAFLSLAWVIRYAEARAQPHREWQALEIED
jgi:hypothetical protein